MRVGAASDARLDSPRVRAPQLLESYALVAQLADRSPSAAPAAPTRNRTPTGACPGVAGATIALVAGPATTSRPPLRTTSTHASGSTRVSPPCETQTHATSASSPGGGAYSR